MSTEAGHNYTFGAPAGKGWPEFGRDGKIVRLVHGSFCVLPNDGTPCAAPPHACVICPQWGEEK